jgi:hypothetical protein
MQFGGEQSPGLTALDVEVNLQPWLSSPRLYHRPVNLVLLLDMIFLEFNSEETYGLRQRDEWNDLVKTNEVLILKPYYFGMYSFINNDHSSESLIRDYCYGLC